MLTKYQIKKIETNLQTIFNDVNKETFLNGLNWYKNENLWCKDIAKKYGINSFKVASIFSALSPRNKLDKNKIDTITVIEAYFNFINPNEIKVSTFHSNKNKAFDILKNLNSINKDSLKTYSFCENLANLNKDFVTIDVWHLRACFLSMRYKQITNLEYLQIKDITIKVANKNNLLGYEFQAIIWEQMRNNYNNYKTN